MKQFRGTIAGKKLNDFRLDQLKAVPTLKERKGMVEDLIYEDGHVHDFFAEYFNTYYNPSLNQSEYLSEDTAVSKMLEIVGTYILSAKDIESERNIKYRFWKSERDYKKSMESENVNTSSLEKNMVDDKVEIIDMFVDKKNDKNQKLVKDISIQAKDLKEIKEIKKLQSVIDYLKSDKGVSDIKRKVDEIIDKVQSEDDLARLRHIQRNTERFLAQYVNNLKENQVLIKKAIRRPIEFKNVLKDEGCETDWLNIIDLNNKKCIKILLGSLNQRNVHGNDLQLILWDLYEFITNDLKLSERELEIVELFAEGFKQVDIAKELNMSKTGVATLVSRIIKKIQDSGYDIE